MRFILEHSLAPRLSAALDALDQANVVVHIRIIYPDGSTPDPIWLRGLRDRGEADSIVVTADPNIYKNPALRSAWLESGQTVVFLKSFADLSHWDQAARLVKWWPEITKGRGEGQEGRWTDSQRERQGRAIRRNQVAPARP